MNKEKKFFIVLGWVTLIGFPVISLSVYQWLEGDWFSLFKTGWPLWYQIPIGATGGIVLGWLLRAYLRLGFMRDIRTHYRGLLKPIGLEKKEYVFLSFCAGVGEEILFRGVIQHFAGIYVTSVLFVALHGYLNPSNFRMLSYGLILTVIFIGVGFMATFIGIYACIVLHMVVDIFLFGMLDEGEGGLQNQEAGEDGPISDF
ncbi:MAG: type II CAAX prenyl endopeptidase Rce1 family protein [Flavobacteriales bacterium]